MKAAVFHGREDVRVEDVPEPQVRPGTVKIKIGWCGICGTDLHEFLEGPIFIPPEGSPHPLTGETLPLVIGHEFAGEVVEAGEGVTRARVGDRVAVEPVIVCHSCPECRRGDYNLCRKVGFIGFSGGGGGFAEYVVVPQGIAHQLGRLGTDEGALVEPVAVGLHAVRKARFGPGQTALVLGAGPIGCVTTQCLRAAGARLVVVTEVAQARKEMARRAGADAVIDPRHEDVVDRVLQLTDGHGVDATFDAAGHPETLTTAIRATTRGGTAVNIAIWGHRVEFDINELVRSEVTLLGSIAYANDHPATIALMNDGRISASQFITGRIPLEEIVERGFGELIANKDQHVKILVQP